MQTIAFSALIYSLLLLAFSMIAAPLVQKYLPQLFVHNPNMLACSVGAITAPCGANPNGIEKLYVGAAANATIPAVTANIHTIGSNITMATDTYFYEIPIVRETWTFTEALTGPVDGQYYLQEVMGEIRGETGAQLAALENLTGSKVVLIVQFKNGNKKVIGTETNPLDLTQNDFKSGAQGSTDRLGTTIKFTGYSGTKAPLYTGTIPLEA